MGTEKKSNKLGEPYTMIPNRVIRSRLLCVYDKAVFACIASCGDDAFPSYEAIISWCQISRERAWKSLRKLEVRKLIVRFKVCGKIHYKTHWDKSPVPHPKDCVKKVRFKRKRVRVANEPVRVTNGLSSCDEPKIVRQTNPIKNPDKELLKSDAEVSTEAGNEEASRRTG